jgi:SAM-dependent methyltransferase
LNEELSSGVAASGFLSPRLMQLHTYGVLYRVEETHWWHTARRRIVVDWIESRYPDSIDLDVLDAGCGTGAMLLQLAHLGSVEGVDMSDEALDFCRQRGLVNVRKADVLRLPFPDSSFDIVTSLDVLEHLDDDVDALSEWRRVLKPGGRLFIFVPAHQWLWSLQDDVSEHRRRYTYGSLRKAILGAGLAIERESYVSAFLLPVIYLGRQWLKVLKRFRKTDTENDLHPAWSNGILRRIFELEIPVLRRMNFPIGASLLCVAVKHD